MALSRAQIVDAAYATLCAHGLAGVSMRRLAQDLGVQPGALYYHVASKQELLAAVGERIFAEPTAVISATDPRQAAGDLRDVLLRVRDGAEVVSFVHAFRPEVLVPFRELERLFAGQFPAMRARWAAHTLIHYVLGAVAEEQNRAELVRAKVLGGESANADAAFRFGVDAIVRGLTALGSARFGDDQDQ